MGTLNENCPTRLPSNQQSTSPDISLVTKSLLTSCDSSTEIGLRSDHLSILISISSSSFLEPIRAPKGTFINIAKSDWPAFQEEIESALRNQPGPTDVYQGEAVLRKVINTASKHHIPSGRRKDVIPQLSDEAKDWMTETNELRARESHSPKMEELNSRIQMSIRKSKEKKWREFISSFDHKTDSSKLWRTIKNLDNKATKIKRNDPINFKFSERKKTITDHKYMSEPFNKQFTSPKPHSTSEQHGDIRKEISRRDLDNGTFFTVPEVEEAIRAAQSSKEAGPDGITMIHLKHLGSEALCYLTKIFNISISTWTLASIWKQSTIIPLLKPGKPVNDSKSYRPISLLCPASKILEKCLLSTIQKHLKCKQHQHGFRRNHSTTSALNEISAAITDGFNKTPPAERTLLVALDLSKAFDLVSHNILLADINRSSLPGYVTRWLACYLHGRQASTMFRDSLSKSRNVRFGVPQGSVLGPILFNFNVSGAPQPPAHINLVSYADDFTVYAKGNNVDSIATEISDYPEQLCEFLQQHQMEVSLEKCSSTLFTPWTKQYKCKSTARSWRSRITRKSSAWHLTTDSSGDHTVRYHARKQQKR